MQVTPDSIAAWCSTPEFEVFQAVVLEKMREHEMILKNCDPSLAGQIGRCQGFISCAEGIASFNFPDVLIEEAEKHRKADAGQRILFALKIKRLADSNLGGQNQP